jgi:lipid A 3-O-deacylase
MFMRIVPVILIIVGLCGFAFSAQASDEDDKGIFNVTIENDLFANADDGYTNGIRFAWLSSEERAPDWAKWSASRFLPLARDGKKRISIAAGQSLFSPADIKLATPTPGDRPYAGWLYASLGIVSDTGKTLDNVVLTIGMVGPAALGEPTQKFVHHVVDSPQPKGWDYQLNNEPGIMLTYERKWRSLYTFSPMGLGADLTPHAGLSLGNINTDASLGAIARLGFKLPDDYGPPRIRPSLPGSDFFIPTGDLGGYLFAGVEGRGVARNIFLDGNTFSNSISVDKKPFIGSAQLGAALTYGEARLSYAHVFLTKEFKGQADNERFGVLTLSYRF